MKHKKGISLSARRSHYGRMFMLPWCIGFLIFFVIPLGQSVWFSFSKVSVSENGVVAPFAWLENYHYILNLNPDYTGNLSKSISEFLYSLPVVIVLSLILALILNQRFRGRMLARAVFFIPAIVASGVVMTLFVSDSSASNMAQGGSSVYFSGGINYEAVLSSMGIPTSFVTLLSTYLGKISSLIWKCSVPCILFLSGLQSVPRSLYEVSEVEGATAWEAFWYITFPMLSRIMVVTIAYTAIDLLTNSDNPVMSQAYNLFFTQQNYHYSSAMLWLYFPIIGLIVAVLMGIITLVSQKRWGM